jgi:hypothetical protein
VGIGGIILCNHPCADEVQEEIEKLRAEGRPVNASRIARQIYRDKASAKLVDLPDELWLAAKHRALDEGITLKEWISEAIRRKLEGA